MFLADQLSRAILNDNESEDDHDYIVNCIEFEDINALQHAQISDQKLTDI